MPRRVGNLTDAVSSCGAQPSRMRLARLNVSAPRLVIQRLLLALGFAAAVCPARGADWVLEGRVVAVVDGDTLTLSDSSKVQHRIRIGGIGAPQRAQPFANVAKDRLSALTYGKIIRARCWKREADGKEVCALSDGVRNIGLEMIRDGLAWHDKRFEGEQTPQERERYAREEESAKAAKRGLWVETNAVAPWEWKAGGGKK